MITDALTCDRPHECGMSVETTSRDEPVSTKVIGLTGGIATGKSTVSRMFTELGARVIDADIIAREVVERGSAGLSELVDAFGADLLTADDELDRAALGAIVFSDDEARRVLESITHPRIGMLMAQRTTDAANEGYPWVIYDAALIVENQLHLGLDGLIVVSCEPSQQLARVQNRDGLSTAEAQARIDAQLPLVDKLAVADWVIDNSATLNETRKQVDDLHAELERLFGALPHRGLHD